MIHKRHFGIILGLFVIVTSLLINQSNELQTQLYKISNTFYPSLSVIIPLMGMIIGLFIISFTLELDKRKFKRGSHHENDF